MECQDSGTSVRRTTPWPRDDKYQDLQPSLRRRGILHSRDGVQNNDGFSGRSAPQNDPRPGQPRPYPTSPFRTSPGQRAGRCEGISCDGIPYRDREIKKSAALWGYASPINQLRACLFSRWEHIVDVFHIPEGAHGIGEVKVEVTICYHLVVVVAEILQLQRPEERWSEDRQVGGVAFGS